MTSRGGAADPRKAVGGGGPWVEVALGSALSRGGEPAQVFIAVDPETGKRWTGLVVLDAEGLNIAKLRNLQSYVEEALGAVEFMELAPRKELTVTEVLTYRPPKRVVFDERFFTWLVAFYRLAVKDHEDRPVAWMAEKLGRPLVTVDRWLTAARERGHLGPEEGRQHRGRRGGKHGK